MYDREDSAKRESERSRAADATVATGNESKGALRPAEHLECE